ncbi:hypothetical protein [Treponema sp.]|uniref:hypothetical protein n=1 Tax=Treponema sp. TaxID=166 RepID=UPI00298DE922|nr:hypothetical protein [Treponema sp.]MCQ2240267.1 hypothetical protein [Treponema sp.]
MKKVLFPLLLSFSLLLASCASSSVGIYEKPSRVNEAISEKQLSSESYCFIRLYDVIYRRTFCSGNMVRRPIRIIGAAGDGVTYVHSAISTMLKDESFVGLSLSKRSNMAQLETIMSPGENEYMNTLDYSRSRCLVLAVPCTNLDVENVKILLEYALVHDTVYGISRVFSVPIQHWRNADNYRHSRDFPIEFAFDSIPLQKEPEEIFKKNIFVCSSFVSYILQNSVERYRVDFLINGQTYGGYTPVDLYYLDGAFELFECGFEQYEDALESFVLKYPEFRKYVE